MINSKYVFREFCISYYIFRMTFLLYFMQKKDIENKNACMKMFINVKIEIYLLLLSPMITPNKQLYDYHYSQ